MGVSAPPDAQLTAKLDDLLAGALGPAGGERLLAACAALPAAPTLASLLSLIAEVTGAPEPSRAGKVP
jgi:hypothetical protein